MSTRHNPDSTHDGSLDGRLATGVTRRAALVGLAGGLVGACLLAAGCSQGDPAPETPAEADKPAADAQAPAAGGQSGAVRLGTLPTEDFLPIWVAQDQGLFPQDVACEITVFQSAQELSTAIAAGEIDLAMTDPMVSAALACGLASDGSVGGVRLLWVTLGADPSQGRFGIATGAESGLSAPEDLRGAHIAVGSNTVPEYVMDRLLESVGIGEEDFVKEEVKKVPVRYQMMESGQVDAAALPASLLALGEATGCVTLIDDTQGDNISQSVMIARSAFADENPQAVEAVASGWDAAAALINADPESYRALLVERASLSEAVAETYPVCAYPTSDTVPTAQMVQPVLDWMLGKGYLERALTFDEATGEFAAA